MPRSSMVFTFIVLLAASTGWSASMEKHSGVVVAADERQVTIEEMGPWRGPSTQPTRRIFQLTDGTKVALAERTSDGADGWPWAFSERMVQPSDLRPGDFVTVTTEPQGARAVAVVVQAVRPGSMTE